MNETYYKHYDRRTMDRYVDKGIVKKEEREKYLKSLPDETPNAKWVEMALEETENSDADSEMNLENGSQMDEEGDDSSETGTN